MHLGTEIPLEDPQDERTYLNKCANNENNHVSYIFICCLITIFQYDDDAVVHRLLSSVQKIVFHTIETLNNVSSKC